MCLVEETKELDEDLIRKYAIIYENSKDYLRPNLTDIKIILNSLKDKYNIVDCNNDEFLEVTKKITDKKYGNTNGKNIKGYKIIKDEKSMELFNKQEKIFINMECILLGINIENNGFYVEGSSLLKKRIICERGLSKKEIEDKWLATEYIIYCNS